MYIEERTFDQRHRIIRQTSALWRHRSLTKATRIGRRNTRHCLGSRNTFPSFRNIWLFPLFDNMAGRTATKNLRNFHFRFG
ncbi:hypothetical protein HMPREF3067_07430 [Corynebacterium sp. HMSC04H06]|nr:hypothetical protein HMPREF3067_07430 [Corynebacterium sp. HMSC04H06]